MRAVASENPLIRKWCIAHQEIVADNSPRRVIGRMQLWTPPRVFLAVAICTPERRDEGANIRREQTAVGIDGVHSNRKRDCPLSQHDVDSARFEIITYEERGARKQADTFDSRGAECVTAVRQHHAVQPHAHLFAVSLERPFVPQLRLHE